MAAHWLFASLLLVTAAPPAPSPLPLAELPTQVLARNDCALVLWDRASGRRIAMLTMHPEAIRVVIDGIETSLAQTSSDGEPVAGFAPRAQFSDGNNRIATTLTIDANSAGGNGIVRDGVIAVTGRDKIEIIAPVAGIAGCNR